MDNKLATKLTKSVDSFVKWFSGKSGVTFLIAKTSDALKEIQALDSMLTKINKTSNLTDWQLKQLGMDAYDAASKYGRTASEYLNHVQKMSESGYSGKKGTAMAETSLLAQSSGDMDATLADNYTLAMNAAYHLNGEVSKLTEILDGQNNIASRNSIAMSDIAAAMTESSSTAANYRVQIQDLSAMIGTMEASTKLGGGEVGDAINTILTSLQDVSSDQVVQTLNEANASMTEMVNGSEQLRNPIDILRDLAETFNQLGEGDPLRASILSNIGQGFHADELSALLQNINLFESMRVDFSEGGGSSLELTRASADTLTGSLNTLSNSWNELVNTIVGSDELQGGVNLLNTLIQGATNLVNVLTPIGTLGAGAGLFAGLQNVGRVKCNPSFEYAYCNIVSYSKSRFLILPFVKYTMESRVELTTVYL